MEADSNMYAQLAIATAMVLVTVIFHGAGLMILTRVLRLEQHEERMAHFSPVSPRGIILTLALVLGLFAIHGLEIWFYAFVYLQGGALPTLHDAVYFSTITYGTIGYDDDGIERTWQLVAAIEGINGVLLMGWSTAFFVALVTRLGRR